jgi:predicted TIM-barrel fold metal-dependent hydrolase
MQQEKWISEALRPLETVTGPGFAIPAHACDCHMHVFGPPELYRGVPDARYTLPEGSLEQYKALSDRLELERAVFVQPSYYGSDNSCLLDAMRRFGRPCRGVVFLPPGSTPADMEKLHRTGVRGIRLDLFKAEQNGASRGDIAAQLKSAARAAKGMGWHIELYAPGHAIRDLLDDLAALDIDFSINHLGYMKPEYGVGEQDFERLVALARTAHCWIKLTGPYRVADDDRRALTDRMARSLIAAAPERAIWGTDWPHLPHGSRDTGELLNRLAAWCPEPETRAAILVRNPARLYGFE